MTMYYVLQKVYRNENSFPQLNDYIHKTMVMNSFIIFNDLNLFLFSPQIRYAQCTR